MEQNGGRSFKGILNMNPMLCNFAAIAVALVYCTWQRHLNSSWRKERLLRKRVAWMLWMMAEQGEKSSPFAGAL